MNDRVQGKVICRVHTGLKNKSNQDSYSHRSSFSFLYDVWYRYLQYRRLQNPPAVSRHPKQYSNSSSAHDEEESAPSKRQSYTTHTTRSTVPI